jgi:predicted HD phosphohydrolase
VTFKQETRAVLCTPVKTAAPPAPVDSHRDAPKTYHDFSAVEFLRSMTSRRITLAWRTHVRARS